jgi:hypothetical protein
MTSRIGREDGFTLTELLVSTAILMTVTGGVFTVMNPSGGIFKTQPEVADVQQRLRVGVDTLKKDLVMAGAGAYSGSLSGSLSNFFASITPYRQGNLAAFDDGPGVYRTDAITIFYVPATSGQTEIEDAMPNVSAELKVKDQPNCPSTGSTKDPLCGFKEGMQVLIYDETGTFDTMTITQVQGAAGHLQHNQQGPLSKAYDVGAKVAQMEQHVYFLDNTTDQLMHYDGYQTVVPIVDNVVALNFEYYGEPSAPALRQPGLNRTVTYGPTPPALGVAQNGWPAGENCTISLIGGAQQPRLPDLGAPGSGLVQLTQAMLTDGPWCPNAANVNRFDADLFRVRKVRVSLRVQTGDPTLRSAIGTGGDALFARPGTSPGGYRQVPDQAIRFDISPRNLNLGR